jgi:hypothetical protein
MVYYAYFNSLISFQIIHWGNSTDSYDIFKIQKFAIRIMINTHLYEIAVGHYLSS